MFDAKIMGSKIKAKREAAGLSVADLARSVYVSPQAVYRWQRGIIMPSLDSLDALADVLDCSVDELMGRSEEQKNKLESIDNIIHCDVCGNAIFGDLNYCDRCGSERLKE